MRDILAVASWWILIQLLGLAAWPLAFRLLRFLPDRGYTAAKPLGLLLTSFVLWLLGSLGLLQNNVGGILFAVAVVVAASAWALSRDGIAAPREWLNRHRGMVVAYEVLFLVAMCGWAIYRATNPGINSTEKPMEFMFLNSILRSTSFPPQDAWLSGFGISYYYFGYVMMAVMTRLSGVASGIAYNVSHGLWFALIAGGAFGAAYQISTPLKNEGQALKSQNSNRKAVLAGLAAAVFIVCLGNLEGTLEIAHLNGIGPASFWQWLDIKDINGPADVNAGSQSLRFYWWWRASRVVHDYTLQGGDQEVIDEFPFFSFLNGDLHPHTLAYPFVFLAISLALNVHYAKRDAGDERQAAGSKTGGLASRILQLAGMKWYELLLYAVCLGALGFLNTWDFPIYLALVVAAYAVRRWQEVTQSSHSELGEESFGSTQDKSFARQAETLRRPKGTARGDIDRVIWDAVKLGATLGIAGFALYLPFYVSFQSQARGILPNLFNATRFPQFLVMFGQFAVPGALFLLALAALRAQTSAWRFWLSSLGWTFGIIIGAAILGLVLGLISPDARAALLAWLSGQPIPGLASDIGSLVGARLVQRVLNPWTAFWLALTIVVIVKLIGRLVTPSASEESEPLSSPSIPFILLLLLLGAALALSVEFIYLADSFGTRMNTVFKFYYQVWALWGVAAACALGVMLSDEKLWLSLRVATGVVAPLLVAAGLVYPITAISTLGDWQHLTLDGTAWVKQSSPDEYAAIQWLNQNVKGTPVVLEAPGESYHAEQSRVSAYTGLPTVLGWGGHELQWRGNYDEPGRREPDIKKLYTTRDAQETLTLLAKYAISYVYVGQVERAMFPTAGLQKFDTLMDIAFRQGNVTIYKRR